MDPDILKELWSEFIIAKQPSGRQYAKDIRQHYDSGTTEPGSVYIEYYDIDRFGQGLADAVMNDHDEAIAVAHRVARSYGGKKAEDNLTLRIWHLPDGYVALPGDLKSHDIGKFLRFRGNICSADMPKDEISSPLFECVKCKCVSFGSAKDFEKIFSPVDCPKEQGGCGRLNGNTRFNFLVELSGKTTAQFFQLEEVQVPGMERQPVTILCYAKGDIAKVWTQDDVIINGVVRSHHKRKGNEYEKRGTIYIEVVSIECQEAIQLDMTPDEFEWLMRLVQRPDYMEFLDNIICPRLKGLQYEKRSCFFLAFGGRGFYYDDTGGLRQFRRGNYHVAIFGDKSTGKSVLGKWIVMISPIGKYHSCENNTKTGLTFGTYKNDVTGETRVRQGVVAMANGGVANIDELDKAEKNHQEALHEPLEDQLITLGKGDVQRGTMMARTAVIALGNPKFGAVSDNLDPFEQFNITPSLYSRFAFTWLVKEIVSEQHDNEILPHLIHHASGNANKRTVEDEEKKLPDPLTCTSIPTYMIKKWVYYAKKNIDPEIRPDIEDFMVKAAKSIRSLGYDTRTATISFRQVSDIVLVSEAVARSRLHHQVEIDDCRIAIDMLMQCYNRLIKDANGTLNVNLIEYGVPLAMRDRLRYILDVLDNLQFHYKGGVPLEKIRELTQAKGISDEVLFADINRLKKEKALWENTPGTYKRGE